MYTHVDPTEEATAALIARIMRRRSIGALKFERFSAANDELLGPLLERHGNATRDISLSGTSVASPVVKAPRLRTLNLSGCRALLAPKLEVPLLRELDVSQTWLSDFEFAKVFKGVADSGAELQVLRARSCKNLSFADVPAMPKLQVLDATRTPITDITLANLCTAAPILRTLYIGECRKLLRPTINAPSLESLSMRTAGSVREVTLTTPALRHLDVSECRFSSRSLMSALSACSETLETLQAVNCHDINALFEPEGWDHAGGDADREAGAAEPPAAPAPLMRMLARLDVGLSAVRDDGVRQLVDAAPALVSLSVRQCFSISSGMRFAHDSLQELELSGTSIGDESVAGILQGCPALRRLSVRGCRGVVCTGFAHPGIDTLDISFTRVTSAALTAVCCSENFPSLKHLTAESCRKTTNAVIVSSSLETLSLSYSPDLVSLKLAAPALVSLRLDRTPWIEELEIHAPLLRNAFVAFGGRKTITKLKSVCPTAHINVGDDIWWKSAAGPPRRAPGGVPSPNARTAREGGSAVGVGGAGRHPGWGSTPASPPSPPRRSATAAADAGAAATRSPAEEPGNAERLAELEAAAEEIRGEMGAEGLTDLQRHGLKMRYQRARAAFKKEERRQRAEACSEVTAPSATSHQRPPRPTADATRADVAAHDVIDSEDRAGVDGAGSNTRPGVVVSDADQTGDRTGTVASSADVESPPAVRGSPPAVRGGAGGHSQETDAASRSGSVVSESRDAMRLESPDLLVLEMRAEDMKRELETEGLTELQRYSLKVRYRRIRAACIKEERRLRESRNAAV